MHTLTHAIAMMLVVLLLMGCQDARGSGPGAKYQVVVEETLVQRMTPPPQPEARTIGIDGGGGSQHSSWFNGNLNLGGGCSDPRALIAIVVVVLVVVIVIEISSSIYDSCSSRPARPTTFDLVLDCAVTRPATTLRIRNGHGLWIPDDLAEAIRRGDYGRALLQPVGQDRIGVAVRVGLRGTGLTVMPMSTGADG